VRRSPSASAVSARKSSSCASLSAQVAYRRSCPGRDERYEPARAAAARGRTTWEAGGERLICHEAAIELVAKQTGQINIRHFGVAADIVGPTETTALEYQRNPSALVLGRSFD
jgi:hypothetical protein